MRRKEDVRLLTGRGTYTDDVNRGQAQAYVLRSPHAPCPHPVDRRDGGEIGTPGTVCTGHDAAADGVRLPVMVDVPGKGGTNFSRPRAGSCKQEKFRFVRNPVALIIAESRAEAQDAAELVEFVENEILPSVTDTGQSPRMRRDLGGERQQPLACCGTADQEAEADAGFARAAKTVSLELINNRLVGNPMEPRVPALRQYDAATESYTLHSPTQGVIRVAAWRG